MKKNILQSKMVDANPTIVIPTIIISIVLAMGIYSYKVFIALQEYFTKTTNYEVEIPKDVFFNPDQYLLVLFAAVVISVMVGIVVNYSLKEFLRQCTQSKESVQD